VVIIAIYEAVKKYLIKHKWPKREQAASGKRNAQTLNYNWIIDTRVFELGNKLKPQLCHATATATTIEIGNKHLPYAILSKPPTTDNRQQQQQHTAYGHNQTHILGTRHTFYQIPFTCQTFAICGQHILKLAPACPTHTHTHHHQYNNNDNRNNRSSYIFCHATHKKRALMPQLKQIS